MSDYLSVLLEQYQVRRTKKQKDDFIVFAKAAAHSAGYPCEEEAVKSGLFVSRNLIAGDPDTARVIFTAHYALQFRPEILPQRRGGRRLPEGPVRVSHPPHPHHAGRGLRSKQSKLRYGLRGEADGGRIERIIGGSI